MKLIRFGSKDYRPVLRKDGRLDVRATVSYGQRDSGKLMLSIYVLCVAKGAGSRGGKTDMSMDINAYREVVPNSMPEDEQRQRLQFALDIMAVRMECEYRLRVPIVTKKQPKYSIVFGESKVTQGELTWHSKT